MPLCRAPGFESEGLEGGVGSPGYMSSPYRERYGLDPPERSKNQTGQLVAAGPSRADSKPKRRTRMTDKAIEEAKKYVQRSIEQQTRLGYRKPKTPTVQAAIKNTAKALDDLMTLRRRAA